MLIKYSVWYTQKIYLAYKNKLYNAYLKGFSV